MRVQIAMAIYNAMKYLRTLQITYCEKLKSNNIIVAENGRDVKLLDYGVEMFINGPKGGLYDEN